MCVLLSPARRTHPADQSPASVPAVSRSIQAINQAVDAEDPAQTLAALRGPGAGLYGVTSECAQTYQDDLAKVKEQKVAEGEETARKPRPPSSQLPSARLLIQSC